MADNYYGEFTYSKAAEFSGNFPVPITYTPYYGPGGSPLYPPPLGYQNYPFDYHELVAIHTGDFTIQAHFKIDYQYWVPGEDDPKPTYTIVGQFNGYLETQSSVLQNYWVLELYEGVITFKVWDHGTESFVASISGSAGIEWEDEFSSYRKANLSSDYIHVAVVRQGDEVRLWINGHIVATEAITDWDESTAIIKYNGQTGYLCYDVPHSPFDVRALHITQTVEWWEDDFIPIDFAAYGGLALQLMIDVKLVQGYAGTTRGKIFIPLRIGVELNNPWLEKAVADSFTTADALTVLKNPMHGVFTLLALELSGFAKEAAQAAGTIDKLTATGFTGLNASGSLQRFTFSGTALLGTVANADIRLPRLTAVGATAFVNVGTAVLQLPALVVNGTLVDLPVGEALLIIPALAAYGRATSHNIEVVGICLNTEINAATFYRNWNFNSMCVFNEDILCASKDGIFIHEGGDDDSQPIEGYLKFFTTDLGVIQQKRLRKIFISGDLSGELEVTSNFDVSEKAEYTAKCSPSLQKSQVVVETNYNNKGVMFGLEIKNKNGADFSINSIDALVVFTTLPPKTYHGVGRGNVVFPSLSGE